MVFLLLFLRIIAIDIFGDSIVAIISTFFNDFFGEPTVFGKCSNCSVSATRTKSGVVDIKQKLFWELFATLKKVKDFKTDAVPTRFFLIAYVKGIKGVKF